MKKTDGPFRKAVCRPGAFAAGAPPNGFLSADFLPDGFSDSGFCRPYLCCEPEPSGSGALVFFGVCLPGVCMSRLLEECFDLRRVAPIGSYGALGACSRVWMDAFRAGLCRIVPDRRPVLRVRTVAGTGRGAFRVKEKSRPKRPALSVESSSGLRINNPATWLPHRKSSGRWHDAAPA